MQSESISYSPEAFEQAFTSRLRELRNQRKISAREMSLSLGQNVNYINLIENGKRMPSMQGFFMICEYLEITPAEFFSATPPASESSNILMKIISKLTPQQSQSIISMINELKN